MYCGGHGVCSLAEVRIYRCSRRESSSMYGEHLFSVAEQYVGELQQDVYIRTRRTKHIIIRSRQVFVLPVANISTRRPSSIGSLSRTTHSQNGYYHTHLALARFRGKIKHIKSELICLFFSLYTAVSPVKLMSCHAKYRDSVVQFLNNVS